MFQLLGAFAEFERNLIKERVKAGLANAKSKGTKLGRPSPEFDEDELIRLRRNGVTIRGIAMKSLCEKAGVRYFRFHPLRHLGASILDHANDNIGSIQRILGHENRTTTEIYLHSIGESEREAMAIFEKVSHDSHTETKKELTHVG